MGSLKNKQVVKNKQEEIRKAAALRPKLGGRRCAPFCIQEEETPFWVLVVREECYRPLHPSGSLRGRCWRPSRWCWEGSYDLPRPHHPFSTSFAGKGYGVWSGHSIVQDADLDECLEHETDPLCDSGLFDMMRVYISTIASSLFIFICPFSINFIRPFWRAWWGCRLCRSAALPCTRGVSKMLKESSEDSGKFLEAIQGVCLNPWLGGDWAKGQA